ncbi:hypothetical protein [Bosea sp. R86505]|uniref:hypothetical protein n=1 Tax=Bosea sp. R86505 TaxID=3101710 RepID=UPI0036707538
MVIQEFEGVKQQRMLGSRSRDGGGSLRERRRIEPSRSHDIGRWERKVEVADPMIGHRPRSSLDLWGDDHVVAQTTHSQVMSELTRHERELIADAINLSLRGEDSAPLQKSEYVQRPLRPLGKPYIEVAVSYFGITLCILSAINALISQEFIRAIVFTFFAVAIDSLITRIRRLHNA